MHIDQKNGERANYFLVKNSDWFRHYDPMTVGELIDNVYKFQLDYKKPNDKDV